MRFEGLLDLLFTTIIPVLISGFLLFLPTGYHRGKNDGIISQQTEDCQAIATKNLSCGPGESGYKRNNVCFCTTRDNKTITFVRELKFNE